LTAAASSGSPPRAQAATSDVRGITLPLRCLTQKPNIVIPDALELTMHRAKCSLFSSWRGLPDALDPDTYYRPTSRVVASVDALFVHDDVLYLLQMTISSQHEEKRKGLDEAIRAVSRRCGRLGNIWIPTVLVFVVPPNLVDVYQEQTVEGEMPASLKAQYVCGIDLNNTQ